MSFDDPRLQAALNQGLAHYGESLWSEPGRMRAVLSDVLGGTSKELRPEIDALATACEADLPAALVATGDSAQAITNLVARGVEPPTARGAVETWQRGLEATGLGATTVPLDPQWPTPPTVPLEPTTPGPAANSGPGARGGGFVPIPGELPATHLGAPPHLQQPIQVVSPPPPPPPGGWAVQAPFAAPKPDNRRTGNIVMISVTAVVLILAATAGGLYLTRSDGKDHASPPTSTRSLATTTTSSRRSTTSANTTAVEATTTPGADVPKPSAAVVHERFDAMIAGDCSPTEEDAFAFLACDVAGYGDARVYFEAWASVDLATYSIQHPSDPKVVHFQGNWPVDARDSERKGLYVSYVNSTGDECREWSYEGTQFEVDICTPGSADADAIAADLQDS